MTIRPRAIANWLYIVAALIVAIVVVGGVTRLTESGLSITEWKPLTGIVPPLTDAQWQAEFANYRKIPQYEAINHGMTLAGFKTIFFWEYFHRFLGRIIGMAYLIPFVWFAARRQIPRGYFLRLFALFALICLQGTFGWLMVRSGLTHRTEVAPGWLATHLLTALFTLAGMVWTALDLRRLARDPGARPARLTGFGLAAGAILAIQLLYGALMAGLRAGRVANDWPLMNGSVFPGPTQSGESIGHMLFDDPAIVHFIHRWWAWAAVVMLVWLARKVKPLYRRASVAIHIAFGTQILLGIATVMSDVNVTLAGLHQLVGALLVIAVTWGIHVIGTRATDRVS
ncbi:MAG: COX15/CtaA family protein [Sphingomonas sp.]|uniref:COX15/CtaA family protein n=1 Tax=Sphingomonas sp. TaxID=28214 RepID=UPI001ACD9277|nr:COX15/CtaA family protein [Sphingomonas sp.]MBN8816858.1 COX15/CtaA family protein [Sphingomonas sp.]